MKHIKVLGSGCKKCQETIDIITNTATEIKVDIKMEKITDEAQFASFGVMTTPAVIVDGRLVQSGGVPSSYNITQWLMLE